jgi:hypothetical protein
VMPDLFPPTTRKREYCSMCSWVLRTHLIARLVPGGFSIWRQPMTTPAYPPDRTVLLIVDPYNDFMSEGGKLHDATRATAETAAFA